MAKTYTLNVAGLTRELTICKVNDHMDIAAFIMLGDAELTVAAAAELLKKCPDFDILQTAYPLATPPFHQTSRQKTTKIAADGSKSPICGKNEHNTNTPSALRQNAQSGRRIPV